MDAAETSEMQKILEGIFSVEAKKRKCLITITTTQITFTQYVEQNDNPCDNASLEGNNRRVSFSRRDSVEPDGNDNLCHNGRGEKNKDDVIYFSDVIGCHCHKLPAMDVGLADGSNSSVVRLTVYAYPHGSKFGSKQHARARKILSFLFDHFQSFEQNCEEAHIWQNAIEHLTRNTSQQLSVGREESLDLRQLLILINPFSGKGKAEQTFTDIVQPMLTESRLNYHVVVTKQAGHAMKYVQGTCLENWSGVIVISGDGLMHEVINGLMTRSDWKQAIEMPLGIVPAGSGNALASSLLHAAGEPYMENFEEHATFHLMKQVVSPLDLMAVDLGSGRRIYSFLQIAWGLVSDVDIESERYRSLGSARITLCALIRIANLRRYRGRVSFLPVDPNCKPKRPVIRGALSAQVNSSSVNSFNSTNPHDTDSNFTSNKRNDSSCNLANFDSDANVGRRAFHRNQSSVDSRCDSETSDMHISEDENVEEEEMFYEVADDRKSIESFRKENDNIRNREFEIQGNNQINSDNNSLKFKDSNSGKFKDNSSGKFKDNSSGKFKDNGSGKFKEFVDDNSNNCKYLNVTKSADDQKNNEMMQNQLNDSISLNSFSSFDEVYSNINYVNTPDKIKDNHQILDEPSKDEICRGILPENFNDPVPDDWLTMEEDFVSIIANVHTHASRDLMFAPGAKADDGYIHLLFAYNGLSRFDLVRLLSEGDITRLASLPNLEVIKVKAFRIIPLSPGNIMTVDGERVEYGPIQAEILPSMGRVMTAMPNKS